MIQTMRLTLILGGLCLTAATAVAFISMQSRGRLDDLSVQLATLRAEETSLLAQFPATSQSVANVLPDAFGWPQDALGDVELAMQQTVLNAAAAANMSVQSFGSVGPNSRCVIACPTYEAELEGGHAEVAAFFSALESATPPVSVANLWMRQLPPNGVSKIALVSLRISVWSLAPNISKEPSQ